MTDILKEKFRIHLSSRAIIFALTLVMSLFYFQSTVFAAMTPESLEKCVIDPKKPADRLAQVTNSKQTLACIQNSSQSECGYNLLPIQGMENYGTNIARNSGTRAEGGYHHGLDVGVAMGKVYKPGPPIVAARDAYKVFTKNSCGSNDAGKYVILYHKYDPSPSDAKKTPQEKAIVEKGSKKCFCTVYMHLHSFTVDAKGDKSKIVVKKDEQIGYMGGTGKSPCGTYQHAIHLHMELRTCDNSGTCEGYATGKSVDPFCNGLCGEGSFTKNCSTCKTNPSAAVCKSTDMSNFKSNPITGPTGNITSDGVQNITQGSKSCSISNYRSSFKECLFCKLFENIFNTASKISANAFKILAPSVLLLVLVGTAIWIAFTLMKHLSSFEVKDPRRMLKEIINKLFVVLIVVVLLNTDPYVIYSLTIEPIFNTGTKLAQLIGGTGSCDLKDLDIVGLGLASGTSGGGLPQSMGLSILCTIKSIQNQIVDVMSLGSTMLCIGFFEKSIGGIPLLPHLGFVFAGLALWIAALLLLVIYPWLLIDTVLKLAVVVALIPPAIGGFAFKSTKKYIGIVWNSFMSTIFTFIFLTIIIFIITSIIESIVGDTIKSINDVGDETLVDSILSTFSIWGNTFLELTFVILLGWAVLGEGTKLAGQFSNVWGSGSANFKENIGSNVGTTMMSGARGVAAPVAKGAVSGAKWTAKNAGRGIATLANKVRFDRQAKKISENEKTTTDENGNAVLTTKNWRGRPITRTLSTGPDGNKKITKVKVGKNKTVTTETDKFLTIKTTTHNKTGAIIGQETAVNTASLKSLLHKDGQVDQVALQAVLQGSMHNKEAVMVAVMNQIIKERHGEKHQIPSDFNSRNVTVGQDEKGQMTFNMVQKNSRGQTQKVSMVFSGNRVKTSIERVSSESLSGNKKSTILSSDGILNKTTTRRYDDQDNIIKRYEENEYSISSYYDKFGSKVFDSLGFTNEELKAQSLMDEKEIEEAIYQTKTYGRLRTDSNFEV
ncbi:MAG: M23 family metallopeptidase [Alphaproteobacteria bacterium]